MERILHLHHLEEEQGKISKRLQGDLISNLAMEEILNLLYFLSAHAICLVLTQDFRFSATLKFMIQLINLTYSTNLK